MDFELSPEQREIQTLCRDFAEREIRPIAHEVDETIRLERVVRSWPDDGSTRAVLARTNRELLAAVDLENEAKSLRETIKTSKGQKLSRAVKRLKVSANDAAHRELEMADALHGRQQQSHQHANKAKQLTKRQ